MHFFAVTILLTALWLLLTIIVGTVFDVSDAAGLLFSMVIAAFIIGVFWAFGELNSEHKNNNTPVQTHQVQ